MTEMTPAMPGDTRGQERERLLRMLAVATFMVFFQAYMVAPIIPALSIAFGTSVQAVGLIVPAYLIPYGIATLAYGLLADRLGIQRVMFASLAVFAVLTALTVTATSIEQIALWRVLTGLGASGVVPLSLCWSAASFPMSSEGGPWDGCSAPWRGEWPSALRWVRSSFPISAGADFSSWWARLAVVCCCPRWAMI
ncbi:MAG: MFS transporter [Dongiaceae bacterium]